MKKKLFIPIILASLAAIWASQKPDGLDKAAQTLSFADKGIERPAVMAGYQLPWVGESRISAVLAGIAGVLVVYFAFVAFLKIYSRRKEVKV